MATATKQTKNKIEILMASDALQPLPPVDWIVEGLISAGSVNIFYGEGGSKKTWALLDMGVCVATGAQWLDFKTIKNHVLIID
jgi:RecA-family ATPase